MTVHSCRRCGATGEAPEDGLPVAWSIGAVDGELRMLCERCTRDHARDIEGKLDEAWWS